MGRIAPASLPGGAFREITIQNNITFQVMKIRNKELNQEMTFSLLSNRLGS